jgi:hypothetical protein
LFRLLNQPEPIVKQEGAAASEEIRVDRTTPVYPLAKISHGVVRPTQEIEVERDAVRSSTDRLYDMLENKDKTALRDGLRHGEEAGKPEKGLVAVLEQYRGKIDSSDGEPYAILSTKTVSGVIPLVVSELPGVSVFCLADVAPKQNAPLPKKLAGEYGLYAIKKPWETRVAYPCLLDLFQPGISNRKRREHDQGRVIGKDPASLALREKFVRGQFVRPPSLMVSTGTLMRRQTNTRTARENEMSDIPDTLGFFGFADTLADEKTVICLNLSGLMSHAMQALLFAASHLYENVEIFVPPGPKIFDEGVFLCLWGKKTTFFAGRLRTSFNQFIFDYTFENHAKTRRTPWEFLGCDRAWNSSVVTVLDTLNFLRTLELISAVAKFAEKVKSGWFKAFLAKNEAFFSGVMAINEGYFRRAQNKISCVTKQLKRAEKFPHDSVRVRTVDVQAAVAAVNKTYHNWSRRNDLCPFRAPSVDLCVCHMYLHPFRMEQERVDADGSRAGYVYCSPYAARVLYHTDATQALALFPNFMKEQVSWLVPTYNAVPPVVVPPEPTLLEVAFLAANAYY